MYFDPVPCSSNSVNRPGLFVIWCSKNPLRLAFSKCKRSFCVSDSKCEGINGGWSAPSVMKKTSVDQLSHILLFLNTPLTHIHHTCWAPSILKNYPYEFSFRYKLQQILVRLFSCAGQTKAGTSLSSDVRRAFSPDFWEIWNTVGSHEQSLRIFDEVRSCVIWHSKEQRLLLFLLCFESPSVLSRSYDIRDTWGVFLSKAVLQKFKAYTDTLQKLSSHQNRNRYDFPA